jgi:hypothetical protein
MEWLGAAHLANALHPFLEVAIDFYRSVKVVLIFGHEVKGAL